MQPQATKPIQVFLLEDHEGAQEALTELLSRTPAGDLIVVGGHNRNSSDLPDRVNKTQAQVVLADLVLIPGIPDTAARKQVEAWGISAIEALRRHCHSDLKIVAYSNWSHLRNEALAAGADAFLSKAATAAEIRQMIRYVMGRVPAPPEDPDNFGRVTALELFPDQREFIVRGDRRTDPLGLDVAPFAFLHYLALERQRNAQYWVERVQCSQDSVSQYRMQEPELWKTVAQRHGVGAAFWEENIDTANIAQWAMKIHNQLRRWHNNAKKLALIRVPGTRKPHGERTCYTLHPGITSEGIIIHDDDSPAQSLS
jgi:DNA-binding NarL/FixJ family response regulator